MNTLYFTRLCDKMKTKKYTNEMRDNNLRNKVLRKTWCCMSSSIYGFLLPLWYLQTLLKGNIH